MPKFERRKYEEIEEILPWWGRLKYTLEGFYIMTGVTAWMVWLTILFMSGDQFFWWMVPMFVEMGVTAVFIMLLIFYPGIYEMIGVGKGSAKTSWVKAIVIPNTINFFINIVVLYFLPYGWLASSIWVIVVTILIFLFGIIKEAYEEAMEELGEFYTGIAFPMGMVVYTIISIIVIIVGLWFGF